jgi:hypothetical protein
VSPVELVGSIDEMQSHAATIARGARLALPGLV